MNFKQWISAVGVATAIMTSSLYSAPLLRDRLLDDIQYDGLTQVPVKDLPKIASLNTKTGQRVMDNALFQDINLLYTTGYFKTVEATSSLTSANRLILTFKLQEYPTVNEIQIFGAAAISQNILATLSPIPIGKVMNTVLIQHYKEDIENLYHTNGYDLARVLQIVFSPSRNIVIDVSEGEISSIEIQGVSANLVPVVLRSLKSTPGSHFNTRRLRVDRESMLKMGYFSDVDAPRLEDSLDHRRVKVIFNTQPRKTNSFDAGLEYYQQKGEQPLTGFIRTDLRHLGIPSDLTSIKIQAAWQDNAPYIQGYTGQYTQPWIMNAIPLSFTVGLWSERLDEFLTRDRNNPRRITFANHRVGAAMELAYPVFDELTVAVRGKSERISPEPTSKIDDYSIRSLSLKTDYRTIGNATNPRNGIYLVNTFEIGGKLGVVNLGGLSFTRIVCTAAGFTEIGPKGILAARITVGSFRPDASTPTTFESEGFDLGGPNTIRGYKETYPIFVGNHEILLNLEYRYDLTDTLQGVCFWDTGQAFTSSWPTSTSGFVSGYGVGIRFYTPVGPLRLDLAKGEALILHFGLGQTF